MGKPLSRPDCLRQNPACLGKGEEEDGYIEDCYVPQRSIYDTMRINEQIDQGCKLSQPSKSTMDRVEIATLSSNGTLGTTTVCDAKAQETKKLDERVIFDALKLSNDTLKSAPVPPRRRPNADRKENVNRRSWKAFIPPNFPDFAERIEASLSEVSEAGTSSHSLHDKTEFSLLLPDSSRLSSCEQTESMSSTSSQIRTPALSSAVSGNQSLEHSADSRCHHVQSFDYYNDSEYDQDPLLAQENTSLVTCSKPGHNFPSATWPRALKNFIKGSLSDGNHKAAEMAYEECVIETLPLSPCLSDEVLDESSNVLIVPNLREKTESELRFEEDELKILMEAEEEWEDIGSGGACHSLTVCDRIMLPCKMEEIGVIASNEGSPDKIGSVSNLDSLSSPSGDTVKPETSLWPETSKDYICCSAVSAGQVTRRRYQKLGSYSDSESDTDSDQLFLELEQQCLSGAGDETSKLHESVPEPEEEKVNVEILSDVEPGNSHRTTSEVSKGPQLDMLQDHTYSKVNCRDLLTPETINLDQIDVACHSDLPSSVPDELMPEQLSNPCKYIDAKACSIAEPDTCHLSNSEEVVTIANTSINETRTFVDLPELSLLPKEERSQCLATSGSEELGLPESSEQPDIALAHGTTKLVLEEVEGTPAPIPVPHTEFYSSVCDMERDSCLGSSGQPGESWTCEASFQSTDIISADSCDEVSDGGELTASTTHGCSSLPDDSLQSSTSASELQELPDDSGGKIEEMASGNQIKNLLIDLVMDNSIANKFSESTTLEVIDYIDYSVTSPQTIELGESLGVAKLCDITNESNVGVAISTCSEDNTGSIHGETATVEPELRDISTDIFVAADTQDNVTCDRSSPSTHEPENEACAALTSSLSFEDLVDEQYFSGLNSLEASISNESRLKDDCPASLSAQHFFTPGEIAEEHNGLVSSEVNSIAVLQEVTLSCSEIDTFPEASIEYSKSSKCVPISSSSEHHLSAKSIIQSSENHYKDMVSLQQALEEQCESPEASSCREDTELELVSKGPDARVHLSDLSDSCSLSVNTRDNSLAFREEGGACVVLQSAADPSDICTGQFDGDHAVLSSSTEVTNKVL